MPSGGRKRALGQELAPSLSSPVRASDLDDGGLFDSILGGDEQPRCACKRTRCVQLYCPCFRAGVACRRECGCDGCMNTTTDHTADVRARSMARNRQAFTPRVVVDESPNKTRTRQRHTRGCRCKKSRCLQGYCECHQNGVACSELCRCVDCANRPC